MPKPSAFELIDSLAPENAALFLDFDGTLAEIVARPSDVTVNARNLASLACLSARMDGALAIVTGRDVETVDGFLAPYQFTISGVHGFEVRRPGQRIARLTADLDALARVRERLARFRDAHDGLLMENKPASVTLHFRQRPELGNKVREVVNAAVAGEDVLKVLPGKMVFEVKAHAGDKGAAVEFFMNDAPFKDRVPVFIGDDVTDEAGFVAVNKRGGVSIRVGDGESAAQYALDDPGAVTDWLEAFAGTPGTRNRLQGTGDKRERT